MCVLAYSKCNHTALCRLPYNLCCNKISNSKPTAYCCRLTVNRQTWRKFVQPCSKFLPTCCKFVQNCQKCAHPRILCKPRAPWWLRCQQRSLVAIIILLAGKVAVSELAMRASSHLATLFFDEAPQRIVCGWRYKYVSGHRGAQPQMDACNVNVC